MMSRKKLKALELLRGNQGQGRSSMMLRKKLKALQNYLMRFQQKLHPVQLSRKIKNLQESTPRRTKVTDVPETSSRRAASSQQTQEEDITDFDPLDHPSLTLARLWPRFEYCPIVYGRSVLLDAQIKLDLPTIIMKEIVRIKEADGSKALCFGALLTRVFENTPILLEEELDELCGGPLNHFAITQSKVLKRINARAAQVDVNPDDVNEVVDELMNDAGGNVNALRQVFSSSMTHQLFVDYHREIMEGIQALQTLDSAHTTQLRGIATTQNLHERRISGLERDRRSIRGTTDRIERHLLGLPAEPVSPPVRPSRPHNLGPDYDSGNASDSEYFFFNPSFSFPCFSFSSFLC
ncbi:hypothetical protein Dimus_017738 [Dionaea muscipula]